jgi:CheY-like chemotaxis protein
VHPWPAMVTSPLRPHVRQARSHRARPWPSWRDGLDVLRELRRASSVPIIILTARGDEADRIVGLELGADDYVVKPFSPKELVSRVELCFDARSPFGRRAKQCCGRPMSRSTHRACVSRSAVTVDLTQTEFNCWRLLSASPGESSPNAAPRRDPRRRLRVYERAIDAREEHPQENRTSAQQPLTPYCPGRRLSVRGCVAGETIEGPGPVVA